MNSPSSLGARIDFRSDSFRHDPFPQLEWLRRNEPLHGDEERTAWYVTRYADVLRVLKESETFSNRIKQRTVGLVFGQAGALSSLDGTDHVHRRKVVGPQLMGPRLADFRPIIENNIQELIAGFAGRGHVDLVAEFAGRLPLNVMLDMFGFAKEDEPLFHDWHRQMFEALGSSGETRRLGMQAHHELSDHAAPMITERLACAGGDLISRIAHSDVANHEQGLEEMQGLISQVLTAGSETTVRAISLMWLNLLQAPEQLAAVRDDPSLWDNVFSETLRHDSPIPENLREVTQPVDVLGRRLWPGEAIQVSLLSANNDEEVFAHPRTFDIFRSDLRFAREMRYAGVDADGRSGHLAFGAGAHFCIGFELARTEAILASQALMPVLGNARLRPGFLPEPTPGDRASGLRSLLIDFDPA